MDGDDVPPTEMRWFRPHRDEIDAVLGDDQLDDAVLDDDLMDVAAIVHDLRSVYLADGHLPRHAALAAFTGAALEGAQLDDKGDPLVTAASNAYGSAPQTAGLPVRAPETEGHRSMFRALTALTATVAGKIALGTAVAAASVGGLVAADVVELPEQADEQAVLATRDAGTGSDEGDESASTAPSEFALEMQAWSDCVDAASAARDEAMADHDASVNGPPGRFDPEEACGERPSNPASGGAQGPPEEIQAFVAAVRAWADCVAEHAPDHATECTKPTPPGGGATDGVDTGEGEGPPEGPPEGTPDGPPEGTPDGPPEDTPDGPPEGIGDLPPEGDAPDGPPEGTPDGPPSGIPGAS